MPLEASERAAGLERMRAYITVLQPLLHLAHWQFIVIDECPTNPDAAASCERLGSRHAAWIRFSEGFFAEGLTIQRHAVVHELLHATTGNLLTACIDTAEWFDPTRCQIVRERMVHELELVVDGLAYLLSPFLPLPPEHEEVT